MTSTVPKTMRALVQDDKEKKVNLEEIDVPALQDNEVLVKISYVAQNPTDWKHAAYGISPPGAMNGSDFSGTIVSAGSSLKVPLQVGDLIAGCVHGGIYTDRGAYAEYARVESDMCFKVPDDLKGAEQATWGIPWVTACQAIIDSQGHSWPPAKVSGNPWYLVYGASSSVGLYAVQLAKLLGYRVLAVASPHSFSLVKSYGADEVIDYHDKDAAIEAAKKITGGGVEYALDTISEKGSPEFSIAIMGDKGKQINFILPVSDELNKSNPKLEIKRTLMYTLFGREFTFAGNKIPASAHDREFGEAIFKHTPELITKYGIRPNPVKIRGGLDDVTTGWEEMKAGKVSGVKLVYKLD